ncbi:MAG: TetR/AcrR family hemagglutinin/protease transcriptional regulator [Gammaproteobacteria bacterium]|jgi:TetR/AcrR family hemagglutinin/protease transcriptional regulator
MKLPAKTPNRRRTRLSPEQRTAQLLDSAVKVFARTGLASGVHAQVAHEAGVAVSTVFIYFPTRDALVDAVITEVDRYLVNLVAVIAQSERSAVDKLLAILHEFSVTVDTAPAYVKIWLNWSADVNESTWPQYVDFQDRIITAFGDIFASGKASGEILNDVSPLLGGHLVMSAGHMIAQMKFRGRDQSEVDKFLTVLIRGAVLSKD